MEQALIARLIEYGPPVLFVAQVFGIFGLPIPDELLMTVAGALVRRGQMDGAATMAAAVAGCSSGITLSYVLGRTVGASALHRLAHVPDAAFARAQRWFARFGHWLLTFGYFIPGIRHVTAIAAGSAPISYAAFARAAYPGAFLWCCVFIGFGYYSGDRWEQAAALLHGHVRLALIVIGVAASLWILGRWVRRSRAN